MIHKSWKQVLMPSGLIEHLSNRPHMKTLDYYVHDRIFHSRKKINYCYICDRCGYSYNVQRTFETVSSCLHCGSKLLRCSRSCSLDKIPNYSKEEDWIDKIINQMSKNYKIYYSKNFPNIVDLQWRHEKDSFFKESKRLSCQFLGGSKMYGNKITYTICQSSLLVPFVWDLNYSWDAQATHKGVGGDYFIHTIGSGSKISTIRR